MNRHHPERGKDAANEAEYTTIGHNGGWYGHPGGPRNEDRRHRRRSKVSSDDPLPFEPDRHAQPGNRPRQDEGGSGAVDYAYGGYGHREPGHARSDPYPRVPHMPGGAETSSGNAKASDQADKS
jgi:hypothetical protein